MPAIPIPKERKNEEEVDKTKSLLFNVIAAIRGIENTKPDNQTTTAFVEKTIASLNSEVNAQLSKVEFSSLGKEDFELLVEMLAEAWTRTARLQMVTGHALESADFCLASVKSQYDKYRNGSKLPINPKISRLISICEHYKGSALIRSISGEQDNNGKRLRALQQFVTAAKYASGLGDVDVSSSLMTAIISDAWNTISAIQTSSSKSLWPLAKVLRDELIKLQSELLDILLVDITSSVTRDDNNSVVSGSSSIDSANFSALDLLRQRLVLSLARAKFVYGSVNEAWDVTTRGLEYIPPPLQKPLWRLRSILLLQMNKSIAPALLKAKEQGADKQARLFVDLARSATNSAQALEWYQKAISTIATSSNESSVDQLPFLLELAQWMGTASVPRQIISDSLIYALDVTYNALNGAVLDLSKSQAKSSSVPSIDLQNSAEQPASRFNLEHAMYGLRASAMLASLESNSHACVQRCLESVFFMIKACSIWSLAIQKHAKSMLNGKGPSDLTAELRDTASLLSDKPTMIPTDALALLGWSPSSAFKRVMAMCMEEASPDVPSSSSFRSLPLIFDCTFAIADRLLDNGYSMYSLYAMGWLRAMLFFLPQDKAVISKSHILVCAHYKAFKILSKLATPDFATALPKTIAGLETSFEDYLSSTAFLNPISHGSGAVASSPSSALLLRQGVADSSSTASLTEDFGDAALQARKCAMSICYDLLELGFLHQALRVSTAIQLPVESVSNSSTTRGGVEVLMLVACAHLHLKRPRDALSVLLPCSASTEAALAKVGDVTLFGECAVMISWSYRQLGDFASAHEAIRRGFVTLDLISRNSSNNNNYNDNVGLRDKDAVDQNASTNSHNNLPRSRKIGTEVVNSRFRSENSVDEVKSLSFVAVKANILIEKTRVCVAQVSAMITFDLDVSADDSSDPCRLVNELIVDLEKVRAMYKLCGDEITEAVANILSIVSNTTFRILMFVKSYVSHCIPMDTMPESDASVLTKYDTPSFEYVHEWVIRTASLCIQLLDESLEIRRTVLANINASQKKVSVVASKGDRKQVLSAVQRAVAIDEQLLALMYFCTFALTRRPPTTRSSAPSVTADEEAVDAVAIYLASTEQPADLIIDDFDSSILVKGIALASSALKTLESDSASGHSASLLFSLGSLLHVISRGDFDRVWLVESSVYDSVSSISDETASARSEMALQTIACLNSMDGTSGWGSSSLLNTLSRCISSLIDSFGASDASSSSFWVMQLQGFIARSWLFSRWKASLCPSNEISRAVERILEVEAEWPSIDRKRIARADATWLKSMSVPWRRLSLAVDPVAVIQKLASLNAMLNSYLCIQTCPDRKTIYVSFGYFDSSVGAKVSSSASVLPGVWFCARMDFSEENSRFFRKLSKQYAEYCDEMSRLMSIYGNENTEGLDFEKIDSPFLDDPLRKKAASLEERLVAIIKDMELLMAPVLGQRGAIAQRAKVAVSDSMKGKQKPVVPHLLLLLDPTLQTLPWEGLAFVVDLFGDCVARDFSMHMLGHRIQSTAATPIAVAASSTKFIVDPLRLDTLKLPFRESIARNIQSVPGIQKWSSVVLSTGDVVSSVCLQDWIAALQGTSKAKPGAFIAHIPSKISCYLPPIDIGALDMENVGLFFMLDQGQNDDSFLKQNIIDNCKDIRELSLESPITMLALLSLSGVNSIVASRWSSSFAFQNNFIYSFWNNFTKKTGSVAAATSSALANANSIERSVEAKSKEQNNSKQLIKSTAAKAGGAKVESTAAKVDVEVDVAAIASNCAVQKSWRIMNRLSIISFGPVASVMYSD